MNLRPLLPPREFGSVPYRARQIGVTRSGVEQGKQMNDVRHVRGNGEAARSREHSGNCVRMVLVRMLRSWETKSVSETCIDRLKATDIGNGGEEFIGKFIFKNMFQSARRIQMNL